MSAFPSYIARLNWSELTQVIEVYALLQQVEAEQQLPVQTALKLLDGEFSDEKVRSFAVRVLETLPDDRLENFLLQLTQALKFEPCHDNSLSRLLLKRALKNKRIGHFFFWYLKCEMYNPLFTPRFAVLLEAYLKGCGEAMLKRFESQLEMQTQLEEIGKQVEKNGNNEASKMQAILQDLLKQHDITSKVITPVYNPRIALGKLNPSKCKIMASKKKPQWLEMRNVDPSALRPTPTRLILKLGDDLRQDVIVLRMLSLFEKLWEKEGLPDLCLIPYGCMATGPNSGFIEVVKNARTIADVSGINDNKKLFEWIKSHQKNEFGEDDPDLLKEAVKRFTHSCAGYTVASYVLGIGDRHNDNVMITKSGNLFHIDFGHFLGNIKYFLGVKREWAPFVLTPDFVYVMGGETSDTFNMYKNLCSRAFLCLRRHNELIFNLFSLMRSTGIPELACVEDAQYIRDALMLTSSEHDAQQAFQQLIKKCLDLQWTVQIMWWIHKKRGGGNSS
jgi:phosphatidylinositol-4,5-bisphosphate 3-kinase